MAIDAANIGIFAKQVPPKIGQKGIAFWVKLRGIRSSAFVNNSCCCNYHEGAAR